MCSVPSAGKVRATYVTASLQSLVLCTSSCTLQAALAGVDSIFLVQPYSVHMLTQGERSENANSYRYRSSGSIHFSEAIFQ